MRGNTRSIFDRADALRREFDMSFAEATTRIVEPYDDLLVIRIAGTSYAVSLGDTRGLHADRALIPVPSPVHEFLGITGLHGDMVPVYDLRLLMGHPVGQPCRWLLLTQSRSMVGLAFDQFDTHIRVRCGQIRNVTEGLARDHVHRLVDLDGQTLPLINIASLLEAMSLRVGMTLNKRSREP